MPRLLRFSLLSLRDVMTTYVPVAIAVLVLLWVAYEAIDPTPPSRVVLAGGLDGSAYQDFAEKYRDILARHRIDERYLQERGPRSCSATCRSGSPT